MWPLDRSSAGVCSDQNPGRTTLPLPLPGLLQIAASDGAAPNERIRVSYIDEHVQYSTDLFARALPDEIHSA
jgi:hypothetical protein